MSVRVEVLYFASLHDAAGRRMEAVHTDAADCRALYGELQRRYGFALPVERVRVSVDGEFANWATPLRDGSEVAFIPPVSGG